MENIFGVIDFLPYFLFQPRKFSDDFPRKSDENGDDERRDDGDGGVINNELSEGENLILTDGKCAGRYCGVPRPVERGDYERVAAGRLRG